MSPRARGRRRGLALAFGIVAALVCAEAAGRVLVGRGALPSGADAAAYFAALKAHPSDLPLPGPPAPKSGAFRIVVLGDSTAAGFPYGEPLSFGAFLAAGLRAATGKECEAVLRAVPGRSSAGVLADLDGALALAPDLCLLYVGHNEMAHRLAQRSPFGRAHHGWAQRILPGLNDVIGELRDAGRARRGGDVAGAPQPQRDVLEKAAPILARGDAEARPPSNLPLSPREIELHQARYRASVAEIVERAAAADVPLVVLEPTSSLLAAPLTSGRAFDPRAQLAWEEGKRLLESDPRAAREKLREARDLDAAPIRLTTAGTAALREGAGASPRVALETESGAIEDRFVDWVHPRPELAASFAEAIARALPPARSPSLADRDHAALERFRSACDAHLRANADRVEPGELDGALLSAQMHLQYGSRAAAEADARAVPAERRTLPLVLLLDMALRWRGADAEANEELEAAARRVPAWRESLAWWRARAE